MITFKNVWKAYAKEISCRRSTALEDISFHLKNGETLGFIGANGAGKSTCIKLLMDFIRPDRGKVELFTYPPSYASIRKRIGYLPEVANFPKNLSLQELINFTAITCEIPNVIKEERSRHSLELLDLEEVRNRPLRTFSKGMQQRANFVIALINDPDLLILDEPMSGLDPIGRRKIIDLIIKLKEKKKTILFCSHILDDVDLLVDYVLLLDKGRKIFFGTPEELKHQERETSFIDAFVSRVRSEEQRSD